MTELGNSTQSSSFEGSAEASVRLLDRLQWDGRFRVYGSVQQLSLSCRALTERTPLSVCACVESDNLESEPKKIARTRGSQTLKFWGGRNQPTDLSKGQQHS